MFPKRALLYGEWVEEIVLAPVAHRHYVFTVPQLLRPLFARRRAKEVRPVQSNDRSWPSQALNGLPDSRARAG